MSEKPSSPLRKKYVLSPEQKKRKADNLRKSRAKRTPERKRFENDRQLQYWAAKKEIYIANARDRYAEQGEIRKEESESNAKCKKKKKKCWRLPHRRRNGTHR
jgi:hypothetical protein